MIFKLLLLLIMIFPIPGFTPIVDPPIFVNPYDPALGGINCDHDCEHFGNGVRITEEHYGKTAACNPKHIGCYISFENDFSSAGPFLCVESGGALLEPMHVPKLGQTVQYVDILWDLTDEQGEQISNSMLPWWNHAVFTDYEVECHT